MQQHVHTWIKKDNEPSLHRILQILITDGEHVQQVIPTHFKGKITVCAHGKDQTQNITSAIILTITHNE